MIEFMGDVVEIYTWEDLHNIRNDPAGDYRLMNDLGPEDEGYDDYASENADNGSGWLPVGERYWDGSQCIEHPFEGGFDGQNHTITGLYIDRTSTDYIGLFGFVGEDVEVRNVGVVDVDVTGDNRVGGLMGYNWGTVKNSYATGDVSGDWYVGGLVGENDEGSVDNSYATGSVSGEVFVGGLVGWNEGTVDNSFWDIETSGTTSSDGGVGKTTAEMMDINTFTDVGWDMI